MKASASTVLPAEDLERATAGLRGGLRIAIAEATSELPNWTPLVVDGPIAGSVPGGRDWCPLHGIGVHASGAGLMRPLADAHGRRDACR